MRRNRASVFLLAVLVCSFLCARSISSTTAQYTYDPHTNQLSSIVYGDGTVIQFEYDELGNLFKKTVTSSGGGAIPPGAPTNVVATGGSQQATITFSPPASDGGSPITGYTVASDPAGGVDADAGTTATVHTVNGLVNGTAYTFTVTAANAAGTGPPSEPSNSVTPTATVPGPPQSPVAADGVAESQVCFQAPITDGGSPITNYTVTSNPEGGVDSDAGRAPTSDPICHLVTGLTNGTAYTFTVTATNEAGTGPPSAPSNTVIPAPRAPDAPLWYYYSPVSGYGKVTAMFIPPYDGGSPITGYTVASDPPGGVDIDAGTVNPAQSAAQLIHPALVQVITHTVTGLENGVSYTFTVTATNEVGTGPPSDPSINVIPGPTAPEQPTAVTAVAGNAQATVSFSPPARECGSPITSYTVTSLPDWKTASGPSSPITVTGLTNGTAYSFYVTATNDLGTGPASFSSNSVTPSSVQIDFNGDGKPDILWRNVSTGMNTVWFMNGVTEISGAALPSAPDLNWKIVGAGDFNGDGKPDILWRNASDGRNAVWFMNGTTQIGGASPPSALDLNWTIVGVGDFNGDGKPDILWRNTANGQNAVWYMNGTTQIGGASLPALADLNWKIAGTGDFNGDGKPDILWRNTSTGENYVWYMDGATQMDGAALPALADLNWMIAGTGDFNGDGKPDILWRNTSTGENHVWYMDGVAKIGDGFIATVKDQNWTIGRTCSY